MRDRKGDWRDLFAAHSLAVDAKKLWLGFCAVLATISLAAFMVVIHRWYLTGGEMGNISMELSESMLPVLCGAWTYLLSMIAPLFNPFLGGWGHFALSILFYLLLLGIWSYCGGAISRLTALQYAKDDIPTLRDALDMVRAKPRAYYFAPVTPLMGVVVFAVINMVIGLIGSIPVAGPWIGAVLMPFVSLPATLVLTFIVVLGVLTFGLMMPAVSIGGKDAFEGWSSAYSYLLWGFNRFVCYTLLAVVLGVLTTIVAYAVSELFILLMTSTVSIGLIGQDLVDYNFAQGGLLADVQPILDEGAGLWAASWVVTVIALIARVMVVAYAFSYFFSANTIICFLLRKHVDRIDVDEVYEEEPEFEGDEEELQEVPAPEGEAEAAEEEEEAGEEQAEAQEEDEEEPAEEEQAEEEDED